MLQEAEPPSAAAAGAAGSASTIMAASRGRLGRVLLIQ